MRSIFARPARPSRRRGVRRREVFSAQFDGGQSAAAYGTSIHLGCDVLEQRIVLAVAPSPFDFSQGTITGYTGDGGVVEIPSSIDGVPVAVIGASAFADKTNITSIVIPASVSVVCDYAFSGMLSLTRVTIGSGVSYIGKEAFSNNNALTSVTIGGGVQVIGKGAFRSNASLTSVTIPGSVTSIGGRSFADNPSLTRATIANAKADIGDYAFEGNAKLATVSLGNGVKSISRGAFEGTGLTAVTIPGTVTSIGENAFYNNANLKSVTIANAKTSVGAFAFADSDPSTPSKLSTVSLGNGVTSIGGYAFAGAALTAVTIPGTVTSIGNNAFLNNANLTRVTIANAKTSIGNAAFGYNSKLATVSLGNGVTTIGGSAFVSAALTAVTIPGSVTSIGGGAFAEIASLKSVTIANAKTSIGDAAFDNSRKLATVSLGNRVTSIGDAAFYGAALTAVTIPASVTSIGNLAFFNNASLKAVTFLGNAPQNVDNNAFAGVAAGGKAIRAATLTGYGLNGSIWNNLIVTPPGRVAAPTVTVSTATLALDASQITIKGTGFVANVPAANTVTFDNGAVGTATAATATQLTVSITTPPNKTGPLKATVTTNIGGSSGAVKQVATVKIAYQAVTVGNPNNANDTGGSKIGAVAYSYQIGTYNVTIGQYAAFLNSVAKTDPYSLYNTKMATDMNVAGIQRSGSSGSYTYSVINNGGNSANRPITYVSWFDAARFANWMTNGQGSGSTETGAYTLKGAVSGNAVAANAGAKFRLPTGNEWYKGAYYSPTTGGTGGYYAYATQSDTAPGNVIGSGTNQANYNNGGYSVTQLSSYDSNQNYLTDVGAFSGSGSFYGTFDQSGNVYQWNDLDGLASSGSSRGLRGGGWNDIVSGPFFVSSSGGFSRDPSFEDSLFGFRLASPV
jgi:formylglycine-generating enzyme